MADEIFDIVDEQDRVIGQAPRPAVHAGGLRHRAVHVLIFNSHSELLVQKRAATKDTFPGCFDSSASGHLGTGEDYDAAACRELREELGLSLPAGAIRKCFKLTACADTGQEFVWVYTGQSDAPVTPDPAEVELVVAMSREQIEALLAEQPATCARSFRRVVREVFKRRLFPPTR